MAGSNTALEQFPRDGIAEELKAEEPARPAYRSRSSFLFLQGVSSPFFSRLAGALRSLGHQVHSVTFNVGDLVYGSGQRLFCNVPLAELDAFYADSFRKHDVSDVVLFGDCRPVHRPAVALARARGIRVHVFEEGYFRPYWITLERDGVNNHSRLPRDPDWYMQVGKHIPRYGNGETFIQSFAARATHDVLYHLGGAFNPLCFPHYRTHAPFSAATEYAGFIRQGLRLLSSKRRDDEQIEAVVRGGAPTFLLPLQLDSDAQVHQHSQYSNMRDVIERVTASFALHAPSDARLLVKNHPLTPGLVNYRKVTAEIASRYGVADRVAFIESGHMPTLLSHIAGMVTINSTAGASALLHNRPTFALADPIYAMPGLTHQGPLDDFWRQPQAPDSTLFKRFRNTVIHTTQVNGGFYTASGIEMAVRNCLEVLLAKTSRLETYL